MSLKPAVQAILDDKALSVAELADILGDSPEPLERIMSGAAESRWSLLHVGTLCTAFPDYEDRILGCLMGKDGLPPLPH